RALQVLGEESCGNREPPSPRRNFPLAIGDPLIDNDVLRRMANDRDRRPEERGVLHRDQHKGLFVARPNNSNAIHAAEVKNLGVGRSTMKIAPCKNSNATIAERITL